MMRAQRPARRAYGQLSRQMGPANRPVTSRVCPRGECTACLDASSEGNCKFGAVSLTWSIGTEPLSLLCLMVCAPGRLDPLGAIMDWRAEVTRGADGIRLREAAERLGRFQVTQAAETVHWLDTANQQIKSNRDVCDPSKSPRENPKLRNNKRKNDNSPAMAPLSKKARKKLKLNQKTPKKGDESIADRVARLHRQIR